jgi:hypothetical protein
MSKTQRSFSFLQSHFFLDAINHFIITMLVFMELTPPLGSRLGATLTKTKMNLGLCLAPPVLAYFALGF